IAENYSTPTENHHPMETHASIANWKNGKLVVYDATQAIKGSQAYLASSFGLKIEDVRLMSPFVGGGFGCKGLIWQNPTLAAMAAQVVKRPVKIVLTRQMMQTNTGRRGETIQKVSLSASNDGKLTAIKHENDTYTNLIDFFEPSGLTTRLLYACPNIEITHNVAKLNIGTPTPMRAPGESPGMFALESAMDELAHELKIDPIKLRLTNYAEVEPQKNLAWSIKNLKECYSVGAEKFGWSKRSLKPRQMRDGRFLVGYGMATATYPAYRQTASARVRVNSDGSVMVMSATQDIGTGTYTVLAQVAADALNVDVKRVKVELGDSNLPAAPTSGGSQSVASVAPAVQAACERLKQRISELSKKVESSNAGYEEVLKANNLSSIEECATTSPEGQPSKAPCSPYKTDAEQNADQQKYSFHSFGAQFAEVRVDEDLGTIRVSRFTSVHDIGRVLNAKTSRSQIYSGVIMGIGAALMEETLYDSRNARPVTRTLADYHIPVNLDVPTIDVHLLNIP
ncbi:MAG: molybdopterin-dependent oxidoreductase, partial [Pyrinomonadaceae bacterium]|nr:molybdopterin-dependent oxidoreductase [Pyrinomonadaceae bacterium]